MKKLVVVLLILLTVFSFSCKKKGGDDKKIIVGATPVPHAEMLKVIVEDAAKEGYTLEIKEFTDYVTPNEALEAGEIDANFFQHIPYLDSFNDEKGFHLVNALGVHIEPMAAFSEKVSDIEGLKKGGASVAVPNDPSNEARALMLLESANLISLRDGSGILATKADIVDNPYNLKIIEVEAASLPRMLQDVDAAVINGNYALSAGFNIKNDAIFVESGDSPYVNVIAVKEGNENSDKIKTLVKLIKNGKVKQYVESTYPAGEVIPVI